MLEDIHIESIIYLGHFFYRGCNTILDNKRIHVVKGTHLALSGNIYQMNCLWDTPLNSPVSSP